MNRAPDDPTRPAKTSIAESGEVADLPEDAAGITNVTVGDDEKTHGLLIKWDTSEWFYAKTDSYRALSDCL